MIFVYEYTTCTLGAFARSAQSQQGFSIDDEVQSRLVPTWFFGTYGYSQTITRCAICHYKQSTHFWNFARCIDLPSA